MHAKIILETSQGPTEERYFPITEVNRTVSQRGPHALLLLHKTGGPISIIRQDMNNSGLVVYIENDNGDTLQVYRGESNPENQKTSNPVPDERAPASKLPDEMRAAIRAEREFGATPQTFDRLEKLLDAAAEATDQHPDEDIG